MNFVNIFENDIIAIFPETFLMIAILILISYGVIYSTSKWYNYPIIISNVSWLVILSMIIFLILNINNPLSNIAIFKNLLIIDNLTTFIKSVIILSSIACILLSLDYMKYEKFNAFEYPILLLLASLGMILIASSYDLLSMYLAIELQSLSLYVLAAFQRNSEFSTEAGLKYFILGAFSSSILLFGSSLIYGFTGTTNFGELSKILSGVYQISILSSSGIIVGIIFILVALLFKIAAAPFHMWAPDVYEGAPTIVTAYFAITPKIAILGLLLRLFFYTFYDFIDQWQQILIISSILSMILAALAALYQDKIKRLLAYSAIGHVGYLLIGLSTGTMIGIQALLIYITIYIVMAINIFGIALSLRMQHGENLYLIKYLKDLSYLSKYNPVVAITLAIVLFSMAGIPPLAGFYSKLYIFFAAIDSQLYLLAIAGVLCSVLASVYYISIIWIVYFSKSYSDSDLDRITLKQMGKELSLMIGISCLFIILFFLHPTPIFLLTHKAALTLCM